MRGRNGGICEEKRRHHLIRSQDDFEEHFLQKQVNGLIIPAHSFQRINSMMTAANGGTTAA
ncbi:MAG: hypothetical protein GY847_15650 [Proteobacteria bacterium]|nr:hypothetical protein [Pseudomonadota bacterium]